MDARALDFPDDSFDAVVSFSSIEHFGDADDIARAASEIGRVLRPGGYAFLVTEVFVRHPLLDHALPQFAVRLATLGRVCRTATPRRHALGDVLTARQVVSQIVTPSRMELMQDLAIGVCPEAYDNVQRVVAENTFASATGEPFPNILVQSHWSTFTSLGLPLRKPG
jgi:SAM-dependent methyltransferase